MKILKADSDESKRRIFEFRYKIYVDELNKTFLPNKSSKNLLFDDLDKESLNIYAEVNNEIIACLRCKKQKIDQRLINKFGLFDKSVSSDTVYAQIDRFMVTPKYRGTKVTLLMMSWIYNYGLENFVDIALVEVEENLVKLYTKVGFVYSRQSYVHSEPDQKRTQLMLRLLDRDNLVNSKSFFLPLLDKHLETFKKKYEDII